MKPAVKNGIAVIKPQGFLDYGNVQSILTMDELNSLKKMNIEMFLVSFSNVVFFNKNGVDFLVKIFKQLREEKRELNTGFCDIDKKKYMTLLKFYPSNRNFSIFKTQKIASLFVSSNQENAKTVLIYNEDKSQRSTLAVELHNRGHNPVVAQSAKEFSEKMMKKESYSAIIELSSLGSFSDNIAARVSGNAIIYVLSDYLDDNVVSQFNFTYHKNSLNVGFRLFVFDAFNVISMNAHGLKFFTNLAVTGAEYNASICIVGMDFSKISTSFREDLEDTGIMFFDSTEAIFNDKELLKDLTKGSAVSNKIKRNLTKLIISNIPGFINATVSTLEMMTNVTAVKNHVQMEQLTLENKENLVAGSVGFYGRIDGMVILIFPMSIAKKACELLLGEETDDIDAILDSLAELTNIIAGKVKRILDDSNINVDITLPRTYDVIDNLLEVVGDSRGVEVSLSFEGENFVFFLTR